MMSHAQKMPQLTVSIVVYKPNLSQLRQTLTSVTSSDVTSHIVVADNSPQALDPEFLKEFPQITYHFNGKNLGYGKGHNGNIKRHGETSPYFLVLNPDVYFNPALLAEMLRRMELDSRIGLSIPRICHPDGHQQLVNRRLPRPQDYFMNFVNNKLKKRVLCSSTYKQYLLEDIDHSKSFVCPTISGCFMLFRREALLDVGGFDPRYFLYLEDTDLSRQVAQKYLTVVFSDLTAHHHWGRGAYTSLKLFMMFARNLVRYFNKWGWFWDQQRDQLNSKISYYSPSQQAGSSVLKKPDLFDSV